MKRLFAALLCVLLLAAALPLSAFAAETDTVRINTVQDLLRLAENCVLDTWSQDRTVVLTGDLDLEGTAFSGIPLFMGRFDGNGHTVSGLALEADASTTGLFRKILEGGVVENLSVSGIVTPGGSAVTVGGIAGENHGTIQNCAFAGVVKGVRCVGGIAGSNGETGRIESCAVSGTVAGEHRSGGIAGENFGTIRASLNRAAVNTENVAGVTPEELDPTLSAEELLDITDVGGVAGYSAGTVQACVNEGAVGYPRVGYNVGGIVGHASGYMEGCTNQGAVRGRKDVGGVVGQLDPDAKWKFSNSKLDELQQKLDELQRRINRLSEDAGAEKSAIASDISEMLAALDRTGDAAEALADESGAWINDNLDTVNELSDRVSVALDGLTLVSGALDDVTALLPEVAGQLSDAADTLGDASEDASSGLRALSDALGNAEDAMRTGKSAAGQIRSGLEHLRKTLDDPEKSNEALREISEGFRALSNAGEGIAEQLRRGGLTELAGDFSAVAASLGKVAEGVAGLTDGIDIRSIDSFLRELRDSFMELDNATEHLRSAVDSLGEAVTEAEKALPEFPIDSPETLEDFMNTVEKKLLPALRNAADSVEDASSEAGRAITAAQTATRDVSSAIEDLRIGLGLGDSDRAAAALDKITEGLRSLAVALDSIAATLRGKGVEELSENLELLADGVRRISDGFSALLNGIDLTEPDAAMKDISESLRTLGETLESLEDSARELAGAANMFGDAGDKISKAAHQAAEALDSFSDALASLHRAAEYARNLMEDLSEKEALAFTRIDLDSQARDDLFRSLEDVNSALKDLTGQLSDTALLDDLQAVSDQLFAVMKFLISMVSEDMTAGGREYVDDISAGGAAQTTGTVSGCVNQAEVDADTNAGGIVGAVTIEFSFDPEDEYDLSALVSGGAKYVIYAVVRDCVNAADISAQKTAAGGIAGRMDYGALSDCESRGAVTASGDYAGGIAGYSRGTLLRCRARTNLSGGNYAGGVAGFGHDLFDCLAMPRFSGPTEFQGSIAGDADGALMGNYYAESGVGGVNGFSYAGRAQSLSYDALVEMAGGGDLFRTVMVTFQADGKVVAAVTVPFGGSVGALPDVPEQDGKYWKWDAFDNRAIYSSITVEGRYVSPLTTISSGEAVPLFLVEGSFYEGQTLTVIPYAAEPADDAELLAAYTLSVADYGDSMIVRMWMEDEGTLYVSDADGLRSAVPYTRDGSYIVFPLDNGGSFVLLRQEKAGWTWIVWAAAAIAAAAAVTVVLLVRRNKKRRARHTNPDAS